MAALLIACAATVSAETLTGRVVGVTDGDTLTILDATHVQHKIRLMGIDAPEKAKSINKLESGQPFSDLSKQNLANLAFGKEAQAEWTKKHRGRLIGKVLIDGRDVSLEQINAGMAWWYERYQKEQTASDQQAYAIAEQAARAKQTGLWKDLAPIPPWDWRKSQQGQKHKGRLPAISAPTNRSEMHKRTSAMLEN